MHYYKRRISRLSDLKGDLAETKFLALVDDSITALGHDYGPPDPPPTYETTNFISMIALLNEEEVLEWIKQHTQNHSYSAYKIVKVDFVKVTTTTSISLG